MLPEGVRPHDVNLQDVTFASFERSLGEQHRQCWQAPQHHQNFVDDASSAPMSARDQENANNNAGNRKRSRSQSAQPSQIGLVNVDAGKKESQSKKPDRKGANGLII